MKIKTFQVGETVLVRRCRSRGGDQVGVVVKKLVTHLAGTELYDVLLEDGRLVAKATTQLQHTIIRQDGVEVK